jgi:hypothetical protein
MLTQDDNDYPETLSVAQPLAHSNDDLTTDENARLRERNAAAEARAEQLYGDKAQEYLPSLEAEASKLTITQGYVGWYSHMYGTERAELLRQFITGMSVHELRGFHSQSNTVLAVAEGSAVFKGEKLTKAQLALPVQIHQSAMARRTMFVEEFVLPSGIVREFFSVCRDQLKTHIAIVNRALIGRLSNGFEFRIPSGSDLTDDELGGLVAAMSMVSKKKYATVPVAVESMMAAILTLKPYTTMSTKLGDVFVPVNQSVAAHDLVVRSNPWFYPRGQLRGDVQATIGDVEAILSRKQFPTAWPKKDLLQAMCRHLCFVDGVVDILPMAKKFVKLMYRDLKAKLAEHHALMKKYELVANINSKNLTPSELRSGNPNNALKELCLHRQWRSPGTLDQVLTPLTSSAPFTHPGIEMVVKVHACQRNFSHLAPDLPDLSGKTVVLGSHKAYDRFMWGEHAQFYDLQQKNVDGLLVQGLDAHDYRSLATAMRNATTVFSDVAVAGTGSSSIAVDKIDTECSYAKNLAILRNVCMAIWENRDTVSWFAIKSFIPPGSMLEVPDYLRILSQRYLYSIIKPGKAHSDEIYIVGAFTGKVQDQLDWYQASIIRCSLFMRVGAGFIMAEGAMGWRFPIMTPEAAEAFDSIPTDKLPIGVAKGVKFLSDEEDLDYSALINATSTPVTLLDAEETRKKYAVMATQVRKEKEAEDQQMIERLQANPLATPEIFQSILKTDKGKLPMPLVPAAKQPLLDLVSRSYPTVALKETGPRGTEMKVLPKEAAPHPPPAPFVKSQLPVLEIQPVTGGPRIVSEEKRKAAADN